MLQSVPNLPVLQENMHFYMCWKSTTSSPASYFAVHDAGRVEVSKQVVHEVVILLVTLSHAIVSRNEGPQRVAHELQKTLLLALAVLLQQPSITAHLKVSWRTKQKHADVRLKKESPNTNKKKIISFTVNANPHDHNTIKIKAQTWKFYMCYQVIQVQF